MTICDICHKPIPVKTFPNGGTWEYGNNARPVTSGRCCDECDDEVVIPARMARLGFQPSENLIAALKRLRAEGLKL